MACYSPLRAVVLGFNPDGKKIIKVLKDSDFTTYSNAVEYISLPCGHCVGCRLKYSRVWADRCMAEAAYHDENLFLTLTYNDDHLPAPFHLEDGSLSPVNPLVKRDVQLFIKRLRKHVIKVFIEKNPDWKEKGLDLPKIRYFLCGEYGEKSMRPHYHLILFGLSLDDLEVLYTSQDSFTYFTSETINKLWYLESDPHVSAGFHIITSVNWNTCAYVARYIMKKQYGYNSSVYEDYNYPSEFTLMSRKPGIGRQFYDDYKFSIYGENEGVYVSTEDGSHKIKSNKYYDRLYDLEYPDHYAAISDERTDKLIVRDFLKSNLTDKFYLDILESENVNVSAKVKALKRGDL